MPHLSEDASAILRRMKSLDAGAGDYFLVDAFTGLLDDNEHRLASALSELLKLKLVEVTPDNEALAMTTAGARHQAFASTHL